VLKKILNIDDKWFFTETNSFLRIFQIYVKGDLLILVPLLILIFLTGLISLKLMFFIFMIYFTLRQFGEMSYWFFQQFSKRTHRPYDFGFKKLGNNAIYIIYQLISFSWVVVGLTIILNFFMK